jgi:hypothetical protein
MAADIFIIYAVNIDLEDMEPPIHGEVLSAFTTSAGAEADAALKRAARGAHAAPLKVKRVSVPTVFADDGPPAVSMADFDKLFQPNASLTPTPLVEAAVYMLVLEGDIGVGLQGIWATRAEAEAKLAEWHSNGTASDQAFGFSYEIARLPVEG